MPRYFFDLHDGDGLTFDNEGRDLDGVEAARQEIQRGLADFVRNALADGTQRTICVRVRDETDKTVIKAAMSILVEVEP